MAEQSLLEKLGLEAVDHHSPMPLYHQVYSSLRNLVTSERMKPGDLLPPELELARAFGVGRQTIREAISRLVDEGRLERFAGRGTFVLEQSARTRFYLDRSFTQQMAEMGIQAHSRILKIAAGRIESSDPDPLQRKLGAPCLRITRLRLGDRLPIGLQTTTILTEHCPGIEKHDFNAESLYTILLTVYRLPIVQISHVVSAVNATEMQAELLQTTAGSPLLLVKTIAYLQSREPIEATTSYYRADKYEYITDYQYNNCEES